MKEWLEKHPKAAKWIREGGLFIIISYVVTFLKYLIMLFLPNLFGAFADNGWGWPNLELTVAGVTFTFNILGYAVADGGLAYFFAVWISIIFGECINFPLQKKFTFKNDGPLSKQLPIYAVGVLAVNLVLNAFNSVWVGLAKYFVYNIVTTVVAGGICMVVFFVVDKIIFAPRLWREKSEMMRRIEMKFEKKAVIFDLDGVICFTDKFHYQAWKALADRLGIYFDEKINDRLRGVSRMASLDIILERATQEYTQEQKEAFAEEKNNTYRELLKNMSPADLTDEVRDTLNELRSRGYKLSIGSSSKNTKFILGQIGLGDFFDAIADGTDITRSKPDPEVFLRSAEKIGIAPADCAVVEDAKAGIEAAKAGGMTALALFGDAKDCGLEDYDLKSFGDLLNIL